MDMYWLWQKWTYHRGIVRGGKPEDAGAASLRASGQPAAQVRHKPLCHHGLDVQCLLSLSHYIYSIGVLSSILDVYRILPQMFA